MGQGGYKIGDKEGIHFVTICRNRMGRCVYKKRIPGYRVRQHQTIQAQEC